MFTRFDVAPPGSILSARLTTMCVLRTACVAVVFFEAPGRGHCMLLKTLMMRPEVGGQ